MQWGRPPPVNRITDTCKNITLHRIKPIVQYAKPHCTLCTWYQNSPFHTLLEGVTDHDGFPCSTSSLLEIPLQLWTFEGACVMTLPGHHDAVTCLQFDDRRIVSGSLDCNLKFWDVHTGACSNTIDWKASEGHTGVVRYVEACGRGHCP